MRHPSVIRDADRPDRERTSICSSFVLHRVFCTFVLYLGCRLLTVSPDLLSIVGSDAGSEDMRITQDETDGGAPHDHHWSHEHQQLQQQTTHHDADDGATTTKVLTKINTVC